MKDSALKGSIGEREVRMGIRLAFWGFCLITLSACGCGGAAETAASADQDTKPEYGLAELLDKPRSELAEIGAELQARVTLQRRAVQEGRLNLGFLPNLPMPLIIPIWTEATFSAKRGISLPPYVRGTEPDPELALHLASFGDRDGALLLADPADAATQKVISGAAYERNYPAEWTRLVALLLFDAELCAGPGRRGSAPAICSLITGKSRKYSAQKPHMVGSARPYFR